MAAREDAQRAIESITFTTRLTNMQVVARHAYALTFEREYVDQWEAQQSRGECGGMAPDTHELDEFEANEGEEALRPR